MSRKEYREPRSATVRISTPFTLRLDSDGQEDYIGPSE